MESVTARQEWRKHWSLPVTAMIGVSGSGLFAYSSGVFMLDITSEFGWSRARYSSVFFLTMVQGLITGPIVGWLVDRFGSRRVVLGGMIPFTACFSALGLVSDNFLQWTAMCLLMSVFQTTITQAAWVAGVIPRFDASRGLALAVTLAGLGLGTFAWPPLAAIYIDALGWRGAFPALALTYLAAALPLTALFFRDPEGRESRSQAGQAGSRGYANAMKSRSFIGLVLAGSLFSCGYYGLVVHFVPVLAGSGVSFTAAAGIAGLIGLAGMAGRLLAGALLDRLPTRAVATVAFLLPLVTLAMLLAFPGSVPAAIVAVLALGFASGAELDVITYVAARRFGQEVFGAIYAIFVAIIAVGASIGPLLAGALFDARGDYGLYLLLLAPIFITAAAVMARVPIGPEREGE